MVPLHEFTALETPDPVGMFTTKGVETTELAPGVRKHVPEYSYTV
jgi:hypothetical protein